ncbi:hypothetical protein PGN82_09250 [Klebsiella aerogenes]|nr:hypothetical protein [Klebsiella aerogenes]EKW3258908.1 hypothetical protein [Klebsiella aerogenes]ELA0221282.1 hypothetical protein [Klebsiella aerogenes]ELA1582608.1 hypothetical protein [Klebsiella aerogenes]ELS5745356.1 hypothetical protein [Klebsiella aerogenes]HBR0006400.1 hypothetical protein [Klebsiella aerogenes]
MAKPDWGELQNGDDPVFSESGFTHGDLLRVHNQYVGRSIKVNGPFCRDTYIWGLGLAFRTLAATTAGEPLFMRRLPKSLTFKGARLSNLILRSTRITDSFPGS